MHLSKSLLWQEDTELFRHALNSKVLGLSAMPCLRDLLLEGTHSPLLQTIVKSSRNNVPILGGNTMSASLLYVLSTRRLTRVFQAINPMTPDSYLVSLTTLEHYLLSQEFWSNES